MKQLTVALSGRSYDILIQPNLLAQAGEKIRAVCPKARKLFVVTDSNVAPLYGEGLTAALEGAGFSVKTHTVLAGESAKCPKNLTLLWEEALEFGLTRTDAVVALGGGVVGDLAGFCAATLLRGVDFIQIPTTLLAQVDSSVGGKVAIDLDHGKNLAGAFWQPKLVLMDPNTLTTLKDRTFSDGMAEVIKYGCIFDEEFFRFLAARPSREEIMADIESVLYQCCDFKRQVVEEDELDTGRRMLLNFGHTLGHAYERMGNYETYTHGQAVAAGMVMACALGEKLGPNEGETGAVQGQNKDGAGRIEGEIRAEQGRSEGEKAALCALLTAFGLPTHIPVKDPSVYAAAIALDKKGSGGDITLVLLEAMGKGVLRSVPKARLMELLAEVEA